MPETTTPLLSPQLLAQLERLSTQEQKRRQRLRVDDATAAGRLAEVNRLAADPARYEVAPLFERPEGALDDWLVGTNDGFRCRARSLQIRSPDVWAWCRAQERS